MLAWPVGNPQVSCQAESHKQNDCSYKWLSLSHKVPEPWAQQEAGRKRSEKIGEITTMSSGGTICGFFNEKWTRLHWR